MEYPIANISDRVRAIVAFVFPIQDIALAFGNIFHCNWNLDDEQLQAIVIRINWGS